ncbi:phosphoribosylaminoimidazolesuccinocarboxamide synthase [Cytophaga hutchinsonii]|uniref:Phosphoribosylaminoimidazole-succinocarboxamide synthase n=1 Tax=Cytophaga hutchinsonii (strain ATCC 33406 / DSM 1761 / CIP 103989 / NBRC 15051 / NCIMB 9469 / D465) TaxID=269798 RepID=PUR7_CYTH3|nr:phosphoribosylaminoimidazolesuccinocarboxamide synthase [Cytophaga hutchinsonii]Q11TT6.1 RecName: Full=Phosphoribosylaminoimidazole-succinocarboxamide synthase; AltName: Full=SAICAR synthetase [Cytophaga hutchinsonii ATCC 33406]ABG59178.1 phosphoribosylaminoimidazole-succinocarboxamide synthase (SAICAR synthetase) [Cytophaga hutchinsonii ATCC 33406]SFX34855.1 phosphoribosylaminoimidazole-succinocarboxamide synthase [Cytophaga hutchinsonii ATCC 33406]
MNAIKETRFELPGQTGFYKGKVRDVYYVADKLVVVASDRISAFDVVLPRAIPFKGQVLNQIAAKMLAQTADVVPNWILSVPDPSVSIGIKCEPFKVEMVIRGYLAGHAAREYKAGKRTLCGVALPEELKENDKLPAPIITPTTKADEGHDEDISREDLLARGIVSEADYIQLEKYTQALFQRGTELAEKQGLILVDTKYEFGKVGDKIYLIDEIHTPDSSRYFYIDGYAERQAKGEAQKQLSKEFVRQWLIENGFQGKEGQNVPVMTDEIVSSISERYIELYEKVIGESFKKPEESNPEERILKNILKAL